MILKKIVKIISVTLIIISIIYFIDYSYQKFALNKNKIKNLNIFFENYNNKGNQIEIKTDYFIVLEIPKINLKNGIYDKNNEQNNIDLNVSILNEADLPDTENGNLILAAHSGNSLVSYFKDLYKLNENDEIFVYYQNKKYRYIVNKIYTLDKQVAFSLAKNNNKKLILITCLDNYKYLIIESIES